MGQNVTKICRRCFRWASYEMRPLLTLRQGMIVFAPSCVVFTSSVEPEVRLERRHTETGGARSWGVKASRGEGPARPPPDSEF